MMDKIIALCPGSFDPVTYGHLDIITRASKMFYKVIVVVAGNASKHCATAIIKGLRAMSDFEYEFQMALTNKKLNPNVETLFLTTAAENMYLSSSMVKQIASMGGDISSFVPEEIRQDIIERIKK